MAGRWFEKAERLQNTTLYKLHPRRSASLFENPRLAMPSPEHLGCGAWDIGVVFGDILLVSPTQGQVPSL
jgi:hypothetical protein